MWVCILPQLVPPMGPDQDDIIASLRSLTIRHVQILNGGTSSIVVFVENLVNNQYGIETFAEK